MLLRYNATVFASAAAAVLLFCCTAVLLRNCNQLQSIPPLLPSCAARRLSPTRCNSSAGSGRMLSVPAYAAAARRVDHMHLHAHVQPMKRNDCVGCMHVSETKPVLEARQTIANPREVFRSRETPGVHVAATCVYNTPYFWSCEQ